MKKLPLLRFSLIYRQKALLSHQGFTLLELMIVIFMVGILTAIALPNLIRQVGRAREVEAVNTLSAIGFAQQAYFFENQQFASTYPDLGITFQANYFDFPAPESIPGTYRTKSQALTKNNGENGSRSYALGTYYLTSGAYEIILCQSSNSSTTTQVPDNISGTCSNGGVIIE
jgi:type IV pilus assembly protein PilA